MLPDFSRDVTVRQTTICVLKSQNLFWKKNIYAAKSEFTNLLRKKEKANRDELFMLRLSERGLYSSKEMNWIHKTYSNLSKKYGPSQERDVNAEGN